METEINWYIMIPVAIAFVLLLIFLIIRNQKDEKEYEKSENTIIGDDHSLEDNENGARKN